MSTMVLANQMGFIVLVHVFYEGGGGVRRRRARMKSKEVLLPQADQVTTSLLGFTIKAKEEDFISKFGKRVE